MSRGSVPKRLVGYDLINFAVRDANHFIAYCEETYAERVKAAALTILNSGARLVMLTGPSSAGKTTSANRLVDEIRSQGKPCVTVSLDDFFLGEGKYPKRPDGGDDYECPEALDLAGLHSFLETLLRDGKAVSPVFDFIKQRPSPEKRTVDCTGGIAIIEGLHALNPILSQGLPSGSLFYVYTGLREEYCDRFGKRVLQTRNIRLARRVIRDHLFRGHTPDFTLKIWEHVCSSEKKYVQAYKDRAHVIFDSSFSYEPCLWGDVLDSLTAQTAPDYREAFLSLRGEFSPFTPLDRALVPPESMLREFLGGVE